MLLSAPSWTCHRHRRTRARWSTHQFSARCVSRWCAHATGCCGWTRCGRLRMCWLLEAPKLLRRAARRASFHPLSACWGVLKIWRCSTSPFTPWRVQQCTAVKHPPQASWNMAAFSRCVRCSSCRNAGATTVPSDLLYSGKSAATTTNVFIALCKQPLSRRRWLHSKTLFSPAALLILPPTCTWRRSYPRVDRCVSLAWQGAIVLRPCATRQHVCLRRTSRRSAASARCRWSFFYVA